MFIVHIHSLNENELNVNVIIELPSKESVDSEKKIEEKGVKMTVNKFYNLLTANKCGLPTNTKRTNDFEILS